jgi:murein DD-endopeptidase MepM/ murein hydrolase activator NlpD
MKKKLIFSGIGFIFLLIAIVICTGYYLKLIPEQIEKSASDLNIIPAGFSGSNIDHSEQGTAQNEPEQTVANATITYPLNNFDNRISLNPFGNYLDGKQSARNVRTDAICPTGKGYVGYHTGTDLEITSDELNTTVPVQSITDGIVRQIGFVNGYGGLIVIEHKISGKTYTAYYGHIDLNSSTLKKGDPVKMGQKIVNLAPECSSGNGYTRKHLHFGLRPGTSIDVKGYVTNKSSLSNWVDPKELLDELSK